MGAGNIYFESSDCGCNHENHNFNPCGPDGPNPIDSASVIYHLLQNTPTNLINLGLPNGTTSQLIFDTIDTYIGEIKATNWSLPFLKGYFTINSLSDFGTAVDAELAILSGDISSLSGSTLIANTKTDTETIKFTLTGTLSRNISADVQISATAENQLTVQADGLFVQPQNIAIDYINKTISISDGDTVSFASIANGNIGWLGNVTSDPISTDGQYWWNSTSNTLKVNIGGGVVKTIVTV